MRNQNQVVIRKDTLAGIIVVIAILIGGFFVADHYIGRSESALKNNIATAIRKEDGKLFLKQFDKEVRNTPAAQIGADYVVKDLHNHAMQSPTQVAQMIIDGQKIQGVKNQYSFSADETRIGIFKKNFLVTHLNPINFSPEDGLSLADAKVQFKGDRGTYNIEDVSKGLFPGKHFYSVKTNSEGISYHTNTGAWMFSGGDGRSFTVNLDFNNGASERDISRDSLVKKLTAVKVWNIEGSPDGYDDSMGPKFSSNLVFNADGTVRTTSVDVLFAYTVSKDDKYLIISGITGGHKITKIKLSNIKSNSFTGVGDMNEDGLRWTYKAENNAVVEKRAQEQLKKFNEESEKAAADSDEDKVLSNGNDKLDSFDGTWEMLDHEGDLDTVPSTITIDNGNIKLEVTGSSSSHSIDDFHWNGTDKAYYLQEGEAVICTLAMVKHKVGDKAETVLKYNNQGSIGYFKK